MNAYLDSSVLLRILLGQPEALTEWPQIDRGVASELVEVECLRTIDRLGSSGAVGEQQIVELRAGAYRLSEALELVSLTRPVLARAAQPMPIPLGTLDALHLSTALLWSEMRNENLVMATHDRALAMAARASGLQVIGS
jgi:predicted nucleic acid-binding protein